MSLWVIPYHMPPAETLVQCAPEQVFHVMTSFARGESPDARVLSESPEGLRVEFRTEIHGLLGGKKTHRTIERVRLDEPREVTFHGEEGPLDLLRDRFFFEPRNGGTLLRYESTVGLKGSIFGWMLCLLYVRPVLGGFMRKHVADARATAESSP